MDAVGGITTILTSEKEAVPTSIRRTLSADMSSRKWMEENGFKSKDSWKPIEEEKMKKELHAPPQIDVWTSILAKKNDECHAPPYVHPLVKRSGNSLSKQSLEVCTESLGSETGSEGFSSYPPSETSDVSDDAKEEETQTEQPQQQQKKKVVTSSYQRKDPLCRTRSFPPPLPSISKENGKSLHVRPHRDDGRLVLEAVSVTEQTNFRARRQDGRLILTFVVDPPTHELLEDDELLVNFGEDNVNGDGEPKYKDEEEEEEEEEKSSVSKLSVLINKPVVLSNRTPTWSNKFSELVLFGEDKKEDVVRCPYGLARGSTYNVYEYFWRSKPTTIISPCRTPNQTVIIKNYTPYHQPVVSKEPSLNRDDDVVLVGVDRVESVVPWMRSCNEKRRSLLFWESPCIATPTS